MGAGRMADVLGGGDVGDAEWQALLRREPVPPDRTERYGDDPSQVVDFYEAASGAGSGGPTVAVLHGGYWRAAYDRTHLRAFAAELARRADRTVALVEYRRVGADGGRGGGGGGWPETAEDVDAALDLLGAPPGVLLGHSAGGQLALWAAARRERAAARVVAVAPLADLARAHELRLSDGAVAAFLGSGRGAGGSGFAPGPDGEQWARELLAEADPMRLLPRVPVEILHGTADTDVPPELSRRYANNWGARLHLLPGVGHFAPFTPDTPAFGVLLETLR
jgi:pimeloyl-ACP methyl ester carboxylesterase